MNSLKKIEKIGLISQLVTLLNSGISVSQAVNVVMESDKKAASFLKSTANYLKMGIPFSKSFAQSKLINKFETTLLSISENSGQLSSGLNYLQSHLENKHFQIAKLKQKCYLPLFILAIAVLATSLLTLVRENSLQALFHSLTGISCFIGIFLFIKYVLIQCDRANEYALNLFWRYPKLRSIKLLRNIFQYNFYYHLQLQLKSGIEVLHAVRALEKLSDQTNYKKSVDICCKLISSGNDLTSALNQSNLIFSNDLHQFLNTSEKSGSLDIGLNSYLSIKESIINEQVDSLIQWFPRILYIFILIIKLVDIRSNQSVILNE